MFLNEGDFIFLHCTCKHSDTRINPFQMVWFESPTNTLLKVLDISKLAKLSHDRGTIIVVHDNTYLTPYFQHPLEHGVDISLYSLSKFMYGHSDVIMGATVLNDSALEKRLRHTQTCKILDVSSLLKKLL